MDEIMPKPWQAIVRVSVNLKIFWENFIFSFDVWKIYWNIFNNKMRKAGKHFGIICKEKTWIASCRYKIKAFFSWLRRRVWISASVGICLLVFLRFLGGSISSQGLLEPRSLNFAYLKIRFKTRSCVVTVFFAKSCLFSHQRPSARLNIGTSFVFICWNIYFLSILFLF